MAKPCIFAQQSASHAEMCIRDRREYDLNRAAELKYGRLPALQKELETFPGAFPITVAAFQKRGMQDVYKRQFGGIRRVACTLLRKDAWLCHRQLFPRTLLLLDVYKRQRRPCPGPRKKGACRYGGAPHFQSPFFRYLPALRTEGVAQGPHACLLYTSGSSRKPA